MYDLAIIGGGPAGTSAAITAAGYGARVLLLEKSSFPRHKVCGEFVSAESLALLASLLPGGQELLQRAPRLAQARVFIESKVLETRIDPPAASIARVELDAALWSSATAQGIDARERQTVSTIADEEHFVIKTAREKWSARSVIDASGRWSNLNLGENGNGNGNGKWLGLKAHFKEVGTPLSVDLYFFQGGYCGVQPIRSAGEERINVCAMVRPEMGRSLQETFQQHPKLNQRSRGWRQLTETVATSPLLFYEPEPLKGRILRVGDAAGFVDPFVGDGISLALRGGALAANSVGRFLQGNNTLEQAGENYRQSYRRDLLSVFHSSSKIRQLLGLPAPIRATILFAFATFPALTRYLVAKTR